MDKIKEVIEDIKSGWKKMEKPKQMGLISIVSVILILILSVTYMLQKTDYQVLFNDLDDASAGVIVEDIEAKGMKYKLENNGSTILIDNDEIDNYRIKLAVDGMLPSSSTGFEIFDGANMMATDEDRAIMYQRAISGELEQAVSSLDSVDSAKILLNIPEDSVFQNPEFRKDASASVVLEMKTSEPLTTQAIQGIASLVSGAVDNLPIENVEILDTNGNLLSTALSNEPGDANLATDHQQIKKSIENDLENKVISLLGPIYGHDKVHVSVNTDLNFDAIEQEDISYGVPEGAEPERGLIRSQTESVSGNSGLSAIVQGSVLDEETVTEFIEGDAEEDNSSYDHTTNYELDSSTARIIKAPGSVENISASVVINAPQRGSDPTVLVRNALGIDAELGNESVEVEFFEPIVEDELQGLPEFAFGTAIMNWLSANRWLVLIGLIVLVIVIAGIRIIISRRNDAIAEELAEYEDQEMLEDTLFDDDAADESEVDIISDEMKAKIKERELSKEKEDEVRDHAKENPELVAELLKIWLNEEK